MAASHHRRRATAARRRCASAGRGGRRTASRGRARGRPARRGTGGAAPTAAGGDVLGGARQRQRRQRAEQQREQLLLVRRRPRGEADEEARQQRAALVDSRAAEAHLEVDEREVGDDGRGPEVELGEAAQRRDLGVAFHPLVEVGEDRHRFARTGGVDVREVEDVGQRGGSSSFARLASSHSRSAARRRELEQAGVGVAWSGHGAQFKEVLRNSSAQIRLRRSRVAVFGLRDRGERHVK